MEEFLAEELPQISAAPLEATYLQWLDFRNLGLEPGKLSEFLVEKAQFLLDWGTNFGAGGEGFGRLNIACPASVLEAGLERLKKACSV